MPRYMEQVAQAPAPKKGRPKKEKLRELPKSGQYTSENLVDTKKVRTFQSGRV